MCKTRPIAMTIAGSDPSGGAGLQADLKTFTALGVYGASIVTALTAQNTAGVTGVLAVPPDFIRAQYQAVTTDLHVAAAKTGMLGDTETVMTVADLLKTSGLGPLVVDPVMVATSGDVLLEPDAVAAVREVLIPLAHLITPNLHEAARLLDCDVAHDNAAVERQAERLLALGCGAVLLKGGHADSAQATDYLVTASGSTLRLSKPRIATRNTHGTGCTLAAAIVAGLAKGLSVEDATREAKSYLWLALKSGSGMHYGAGSGPVDHLHALFPCEDPA
jgi:hydroxymethylpyrimidine/phosphomethylpyrimidine kinase